MINCGQAIECGYDAPTGRVDRCLAINNLKFDAKPIANLGAKVEYRFDPKLSVQLAYDPATEKRTCTGGQSIFGLVPAPPNFSVSLSHVWRF